MGEAERKEGVGRGREAVGRGGEWEGGPEGVGMENHAL